MLAKHYPNDILISGFDILFFWDARMAMQGLHFMKEVPWKTLYLHGLVRAPDGSKMSKSKGNTVDPLGLIDKYGADALRFTLAAMESQGRDIKLDEKRVEGYRNFATKLWNAARFLQGNGVKASQSVTVPAAHQPINRWIIGTLGETMVYLNGAFAQLRYDWIADTIYGFAWSTFCDQYIELIKGAFDDETREVAAWVFDQILTILHPVMPFITEELWHAMGARPYDIIHAQWPVVFTGVSAQDHAETGFIFRNITAIRSARTELGVPPGAKVYCGIDGGDNQSLEFLARNRGVFERVARIHGFDQVGADRSNTLQVVDRDLTFYLKLEGIIDLDAERARIAKGIEAATKEAESVSKRLDNPSFIERAKPEAIAKAREDFAEKSAEAERLRAALARLG